MEQREIAMTNDEMQKVSVRLLEAMNKAQFVDGHSLDEVLMTALYVVGAGIKRRGAVLDMNAPLRVALQPLVAGYEAEAKRLGKHQ